MRIVVLSDSHGNYRALWSVVKAQPEAEVFLHLGDGEREFEQLRLEFPEKMMRGVSGNCDWGSVSEKADLVTLCGKRIFYTHGHLLRVKTGLEDVLLAAKQLRANVALFGHTHVPYTGYTDGLYVMNPGSIAMPRNGMESTYGVLDITQAGIFTTIVPLTHEAWRR